MVLNYERNSGSSNFKNYPEENMDNAVDAVRADMSQKLVSIIFKVTCLSSTFNGSSFGGIATQLVIQEFWRMKRPQFWRLL